MDWKGRLATNLIPVLNITYDAPHEKTDLKIFFVVIPKEGWAGMTTPILLLV